MSKPMPNLAFHAMSAIFYLRNHLFPRQGILKEAGIKPGFHVLDYGCGPGAYLLDTAKMVGQSGMVYTLDLHPLAIQKVKAIAQKNGLTNVKTIRSDCQTGLANNSLDVVLLYDIYHMLNEPQAVLTELHRILKPDGILSFNDPHMQADDAIAKVTNSLFFTLLKRGEKTFSFSKRNG